MENVLYKNKVFQNIKQFVWWMRVVLPRKVKCSYHHISRVTFPKGTS